VILRTESGRSVHGLTTAASIWLAACLGCACGAGAWVITLCAFAFVMLILLVGGPVERWVLGKLKPPREEEEM
jgi:putative Mg2+ transporter-C (MgtC) family protein